MNIFEDSIPEIEKKIGYTFRDKSLLKQAFTRGSFCNEINKRKCENYKSNEVLEFFGDSVLSAAIVTALIKQKTERYPHGINTELNEGDFSNIRSKLADKKNLSDNISRLGLEEYLIMGEGDKKLLPILFGFEYCVLSLDTGDGKNLFLHQYSFVQYCLNCSPSL